MKTVSVIVPCYNGESFIDRCLSSIISQDYPSVEVIVIDDGSTDNSKKIILSWTDRFLSKGFQLRYIFQENQGSGGAVNTGLKYVTGEYLSLLDVDDEYLPGAISQRTDYLEAHPDVDVVRSNGWYVRKTGKSLFVYDDKEKQKKNIFVSLLEGTTNNWAGSYMVRTSSLFEFYPEREIHCSRYGQNLQFLLPLVYKKECGFIDTPHMNYIQQENSLSKVSDPQKAKSKGIENAKGYRDIRVHMVKCVVKDEQEQQHFFHVVDSGYWRSIMQIALQYEDCALLKNAYKMIEKLGDISINDKIIYNQFCHPVYAIILRGIRKIGILLRNDP